jgi:UDP-glucose 4-epimerase
MFVSQAVESAVRRTNFEMSKGEQKRDLLFVTDFVNVIIKLLTANGTDGEIYNAGSGQSIALKDLAKKIWKIAGADEKLLKIGARQTNDNELHNTQADITKIMRAINWKPEISLDEGLELVVKKAKKDFLR